MSLKSLKETVCNEIDKMGQQLLSVSREIHANPELGMKEYKAAALIAKTLEENGIQVSRQAYGLETAFESEFGTGDCRVALLAEYDALPNIGHACGHNLIATAALGATLALAKLNTELPGRIRFLGTPAEENVGGKELMARAGAFEEVDAALMIHPSGVNAATMPCICVATAHVVYKGKAAHASVMPHRGINALDALVTAYQSIAQLRQHIKPTERLHGIFTEAGDAANIVPERAAGQFMVRAGR